MPTDNILITRRNNLRVHKPQRDKIEVGVQKARQMIRGMQQDMEKIWQQEGKGAQRKRETAWLKNSKFTEWMGDDALNKSQINGVRRTLRQIRKHIEQDLLQIRVQSLEANGCGKKGFNAFVRTGPVIHLCPDWFKRDPDVAASILIHEAAHLKIGLAGTSSHKQSFDGDTARTTARLHPRKARRAPENYERLAREYA